MKIQPLYYTIITPKGEAYVNDGELAGKEFVFNTRIDRSDYTYTNRIGIVVSEPAYEAPYKEGDEVLVHHNVFRNFWNQQGDLQATANLIKDDLFYADEQTIYGYRKPGGEWTMLPEYLLVRPLRDEDGLIYLHGEIVAGEGKGSIILMNENCEYEFWIDGDLFYRVRACDVAAKIL